MDSERNLPKLVNFGGEGGRGEGRGNGEMNYAMVEGVNSRACMG